MRPNIIFYNKPDPNRYGREKQPDIGRLIQAVISDNLGKQACTIVELGCGKGALQHIHPNYIGLDISFFALETYLHKPAIQADMEFLPFKNNVVDMVFSIAAIEHIPHPERCLAEIDRILCPGGIAILAPAWFCRPAQPKICVISGIVNWDG